MAYGARLESVLGASPRGFESPILRQSTSFSNRMVPVTQQATGRPDGRRARVRRHRRERQIIVFGALALALGFGAVFAAGIYKGTINGPVSVAFVTPAGQFESDVTLVCPAPDSLPLTADQVAVQVLNATDTSGLATRLSDDLKGRGFVTVGTGNWGRSYGENIRISFGPAGVQQAYTVALQFEGATQLVLDNREGTLVDVVIGTKFVDAPRLRSVLAAELSPELPLSANAECLPVTLVTPEPAPRNLPANPLDPEATASPSPSVSPSVSASS